MIAFDLRCSENHTFEAWFKDRAAFEEQRDRGLISCPVCGCHQVEKILSPVAIRRSPSSHAPDQTAGDGLEIQKGFLKAMQKIYETVIENMTVRMMMYYGRRRLSQHSSCGSATRINSSKVISGSVVSMTQRVHI